MKNTGKVLILALVAMTVFSIDASAQDPHAWAAIASDFWNSIKEEVKTIATIVYHTFPG